MYFETCTPLRGLKLCMFWGPSGLSFSGPYALQRQRVEKHYCQVGKSDWVRDKYHMRHSPYVVGRYESSRARVNGEVTGLAVSFRSRH